jgi:hypothetical protein
VWRREIGLSSDDLAEYLAALFSGLIKKHRKEVRRNVLT